MESPDPSQHGQLDSIARAAREVEASLAAREQQNRPRQLPNFGKWVLAIAVIGAFVYLAPQLRRQLLPPSKDQIARDLEHAVNLARASVEEYKTRTGELPPALPHASLASVVRYERRRSEYHLSTATGSVRVTVEWDGSKSTELDAKE